MVSWKNVQNFLRKVNSINSQSSFLYRIPTAEEWEYILRGGPIFKSQSRFHFYFSRNNNDLTAVASNDLSSTQANFDGNYPAGAAKKGLYLKATSAVGKYLPNPLGFYDMHGNVREWTATEEGSVCVNCGGSWSDLGVYCTASARSRNSPINRFNDLGFRLLAVPHGE